MQQTQTQVIVVTKTPQIQPKHEMIGPSQKLKPFEGEKIDGE